MAKSSPMPSIPSERIALRAAEAAKLIGIGRTKFLALDRSGRLPRPRRLGRAVLWDRAELIAWFAAGTPPRDRWEAIKREEK